MDNFTGPKFTEKLFKIQDANTVLQLSRILIHTDKDCLLWMMFFHDRFEPLKCSLRTLSVDLNSSATFICLTTRSTSKPEVVFQYESFLMIVDMKDGPTSLMRKVSKLFPNSCVRRKLNQGLLNIGLRQDKEIKLRCFD